MIILLELLQFWWENEGIFEWGESSFLFSSKISFNLKEALDIFLVCYPLNHYIAR
jgi:hypothetical protein